MKIKDNWELSKKKKKKKPQEKPKVVSKADSINTLV